MDKKYKKFTAKGSNIGLKLFEMRFSKIIKKR